jgi:hypothetical protein
MVFVQCGQIVRELGSVQVELIAGEYVELDEVCFGGEWCGYLNQLTECMVNS